MRSTKRDVHQAHFHNHDVYDQFHSFSIGSPEEKVRRFLGYNFFQGPFIWMVYIESLTRCFTDIDLAIESPIETCTELFVA